MNLLSTLLLAALAAVVALLSGPQVLVVNSVPALAPVAAEDLDAALASRDTVRVALNPEVAQTVTERFAEGRLLSWRPHGKTSLPRQWMARLAANRDIPEVNADIRSVTPYRSSGSTWWLNPEGDYDFTEVTLTAILYLYGDRPDRLYPETVQYLLDNLLLEEGGEPCLKVPNTLGQIFDTENHVLMTESSRYLKNQWLRHHGSRKRRHDNARTGLQQWLLGRLNHIRVHGFHEFNSDPYERYAVQALLNLEAFAEPPEVAAMARRILDDQVWRYAYGALPATPGGLDLRRSVPFRRQLKHLSDPQLNLGYLSKALPLWAAPGADAQGLPDDVVGALLPYRPPQAAIDFARAKTREYFVQIGHGPSSSPEIISAGPGYVLSAGGTFRGEHTEIVPRPTVLLLEDGARRIDQTFHLPGPADLQHWNHTGVHHRFACGNVPVQTPAAYAPEAEAASWRIYALPAPTPLTLAVYNDADFGLMALFPAPAPPPAELLAALRRANPNPVRLRRTFQWPDGPEITYDPQSPPGTRVIEHAPGQPLDRHYDAWPLFRETPL
jgi:hypothetical protein